MKKYSLYVLTFALGGLATYLFLQETIIKEKSEELQNVRETLIVQKKESEQAIRTLETRLAQSKKSRTERIQSPDGTTRETVETEEALETIEKRTEDIRRVYEEIIAAQKEEFTKKVKELSVHKNKKRLGIYVGQTLDLKPYKREYTVGITYDIWGPVSVGGTFTSNGVITPMIGIRF